MNTTGINMIADPIAVVIDFYLQGPSSAPKRRTMPDRRPDLDKLVRSTFDALTTASVIEDDARIVEIVARKHYATSGCGARISVRSAASAVSPE
jgi:Holliday junction resolvase RusA-like endonuclease